MEEVRRQLAPYLLPDEHLLWCVTEKMDKQAIDEVVAVIKEVCGQ